MQSCTSQRMRTNVVSVVFALMALAASVGVLALETNGTSIMFGSESSAAWLLLSAFGIGLALTFTPCVLPLIPIVSAIVVSEHSEHGNNRVRGGILSIAYVVGTIVTYSAIGAVAGATGDQLQAYFQNPWVLGLMSAVITAAALSLFGLYELRLPSVFETKMQESSARLGGGRIGTVFVLGAVSALIVGACVTPLLISVLGIVIARGDPWFGAASMASMALGMGVVLIAIGFGLSSALPKTGAWMETVKHILGVMLIALAIYLLEPITQVPTLLLWAVLFIVVAVYLGATRKLPQESNGRQVVLKGLGVAVMVWGVVSLVGASVGNRDVINPLPQLPALLSMGGTGGSSAPAQFKSPFTYARTNKEFEQFIQLADDANKPLLIDFYANWCLDCKRMDRTTFRDSDVVARLQQNYTAVKIDVTDPDDEFSRSLRKQLNVFGPPALVLISQGSQVVSDRIMYGYLNVEQMMDFLDG